MEQSISWLTELSASANNLGSVAKLVNPTVCVCVCVRVCACVCVCVRVCVFGMAGGGNSPLHAFLHPGWNCLVVQCCRSGHVFCQ